jgi:ribosomal protein S18 acetylase RimI-like enzyme
VRAGAGVGRQLLDAVAASARAAGAARLLVMTTNDNLAALRFYQRRGFRLADLRPGAVDEARASG